MNIDFSKMGASARITSQLLASDMALTLLKEDIRKLAPASGMAVYLTIRSGGAMERVLATGVTPNGLIIERGVDGTNPQYFRAGSCLSIEWNPEQLSSFIRVVTGTQTGGITGTFTTPGVFTFGNGILKNFKNSEGC